MSYYAVRQARTKVIGSRAMTRAEADREVALWRQEIAAARVMPVTPELRRAVAAGDQAVLSRVLAQPGARFEHAHMRDPGDVTLGTPARCTVTRIQGGRVHWTYTADYDAGDCKGGFYFSLSDVHAHVARWLSVSDLGHEADVTPQEGGGFLVTCPAGCNLGTSALARTEDEAAGRVRLHMISTRPLVAR